MSTQISDYFKYTMLSEFSSFFNIPATFFVQRVYEIQPLLLYQKSSELTVFFPSPIMIVYLVFLNYVIKATSKNRSYLG